MLKKFIHKEKIIYTGNDPKLIKKFGKFVLVPFYKGAVPPMEELKQVHRNLYLYDDERKKVFSLEGLNPIDFTSKKEYDLLPNS